MHPLKCKKNLSVLIMLYRRENYESLAFGITVDIKMKSAFVGDFNLRRKFRQHRKHTLKILEHALHQQKSFEM